MNEQGKKPLFSIITVCYNAAKTIEKTIQSVLNQTFDDLEYIIIDGDSNDGTMEVVNKYRNEITYIISEPDDGIYDAMNKGIALASGEIVGIINSDDWYESDALEIIKNAYENSNKQTIIYGLCKYIKNEKEGMILSYHHDVLPEMNIAHPTCFVPKTIYDMVGVYDKKYAVSADYDFLLRCYLRDISYKRVERTLANFRMGGFSSNHDGQCEKLKIQLYHGVIDKKKYFIRVFIRKYRGTKNKLIKMMYKVYK